MHGDAQSNISLATRALSLPLVSIRVHRGLQLAERVTLQLCCKDHQYAVPVCLWSFGGAWLCVRHSTMLECLPDLRIDLVADLQSSNVI